DFAVVSLANAEPGGIPFNQAVLRWALEHYLGVVDGDPEPLPYDAGRAAELAGSYGNDVMDLVIADHGDGLTLAAGIKAEIRAAARGEMPPDVPPSGLGLLPGDEYLVTEGSMRGQRGYATRDAAGRITGVDLAGRLFPRAGR
ncbi:MAG: serine hydrolase, partial [Nonomuraea sp.]|nr:serine hydrolase [Nonomuraea sp.]